MAAEQGHAYAQFNLGNCYYNGLGVVQNYEEARKWYGKAAEQGNAEAKQALSVMDNQVGAIANENQNLSPYWIDPGQCVACGSCAAQCPCEAIKYVGIHYSIDPGKCVCCGACKDNCPVEAIHEPGDNVQYQSNAGQQYVQPNWNPNQQSALGEFWQNAKQSATPFLGKTLGDLAGNVLRGIFGG